MSEFFFTHGQDIECPRCPPQEPRNQKPLLEVVERNYSGTFSDLGVCPECGEAWGITYQVCGMTRAKSWDQPTREEREWAAAWAASKAERLLEAKEWAEYARLKGKYGTGK